MLDKNFLKENLKDADIVYHLAGITDVAYVKKDSNKEQDEKIKTIEKKDSYHWWSLREQEM